MATLSQAARRYPDFLRGRLDPSGCRLSVQFFGPDGRAGSVGVDRSLLLSRGWTGLPLGLGASSMGSPREPIWPALFEQAFARTFAEEGSYRSIEGASGRDALRWLTGLPVRHVRLRETWASAPSVADAANAFRDLDAAWTAGELVILHVGGHAFELVNVSHRPDALIAQTTAQLRARPWWKTGSSTAAFDLRIPSERVFEMVGAYAFTQGARHLLSASKGKGMAVSGAAEARPRVLSLA